MARLEKHGVLPSRPIRICLVGPSPDMIGGQAVSAARLLTRLAENPQLEVSFLAVNPRLPSILRPLRRVKYVRTVVTSLVYFFSLLVRIPRVDVVHVFSASYWSFLLAPVPAMFAGRLFRKGVILNYRSGEADDHLSNWRTVIPLCRLAQLIVVPSGYLVDVFARHGLAAQAVPNFVETAQLPYRRRESLRPTFLSNRNFEEHYNISCILRAFKRVQRQFSEASMVIAGDGPLRRRLHEEAEELGVQNVTFVGAVPPKVMASLYNDADIFLNAPVLDNMPNTILEAAACGLPIISTDAGGIPYIVEDGVTAMLVSTDDDAALAAKAIHLLENLELAFRITAAAREKILNHYTWSAVKADWMEIYRTLQRRRQKS